MEPSTKQEIFRAMQQNCPAGVKFSPCYSGRGMREDTCPAISGYIGDCKKVIAATIQNLASATLSLDRDSLPVAVDVFNDAVGLLMNYYQDTAPDGDSVLYWR
jgi:hypothetical protein